MDVQEAEKRDKERDKKAFFIFKTCKCFEVNHFLFILAMPLLSISLVAFFMPCLIIGTTSCDLRSESILNGGKQGATPASPRRLLHPVLLVQGVNVIVRCACLHPAVLLCGVLWL